MSAEESRQVEKETNDFLLSLDWNTKFKLRELITPLLNQSKCEHEWVDPNSYDNILDKNFMYCFKCQLIKTKE